MGPIILGGFTVEVFCVPGFWAFLVELALPPPPPPPPEEPPGIVILTDVVAPVPIRFVAPTETVMLEPAVRPLSSQTASVGLTNVHARLTV